MKLKELQHQLLALSIAEKAQAIQLWAASLSNGWIGIEITLIRSVCLGVMLPCGSNSLMLSLGGAIASRRVPRPSLEGAMKGTWF